MIFSDGDDRMGAKVKTKKIPGPKINLKKSHAEFSSVKVFQNALNDMRSG